MIICYGDGDDDCSGNVILCSGVVVAFWGREGEFSKRLVEKIHDNTIDMEKEGERMRVRERAMDGWGLFWRET